MFIEGVTEKTRKHLIEYQDPSPAEFDLQGFNYDGVYIAGTSIIPAQKNISKLSRYKFSNLTKQTTLEVNPTSTYFIEIENKKTDNKDASLKLKLLRSGNNIGRVVITGDATALKMIEIVGGDTPEHQDDNSTPELFDDRLLTGCLTFLDAKFADLAIKASNLHCEDMVNFVRSSGTVREMQLSDGSFDALDVDFSNIAFGNLSLKRAGNDCADFSAGVYSIDKLIADNCADKAISVGEMSQLSVGTAIINEASIGVASKDGSTTTVKYANMTNVGSCFAAYRKKQEFDGGTIRYNNLDGECHTFLDKDFSSSIMQYD